MYKLSVVFLSLFVILISCGGPKKETPTMSNISKDTSFVAAVKNIEPMTVISIAKKGPYSEAGKAMGELMAWIMGKKIQPLGMPFGIYYDDPMKVVPESTKFEICIPVSPDTKGEKGYLVKQLPAMEVIYSMHTGPYEKVSETYGKLMSWAGKNNYTITGAPHEFYINNPSQTLPESLKTEILFPVKKNQ